MIKNWDEIAEIAKNHPYFTLLQDEVLNKKRSVLCTLLNHDNLSGEWDRLKNRITALFNIFEEVGLFILRKGALESYYDDNVIEDKVNASVIESEKNFINFIRR